MARRNPSGKACLARGAEDGPGVYCRDKWLSEPDPKRKHNPATFAPADLDGEDLLEIFETWAKSLDTSDTHNEKRQTWVNVAAVMRYAPRVIMLDLRVGAYGEPGDLVDINTGAPVGQIKDHQAPTGENGAMLFVPERGERAHFLSEVSSRGSAGGRILSLFKKHFSQYTDQITMVTAPVTEGETWREAAKLTEVEVRVTGKSADVADGLTEVVAVDELPEDHDVFVTMVRDGRTKKFQLGSEGAPAIREVLNDSNEEALDVDKLVETCTEKVRDLLARTGGEWDAAWSRPTQQGA